MKHNEGFLLLVNEAKKHIEETDIHQVRQWLEKKVPFTLIDVREDNEWVKCRIPDSIHMGKGILERDIEARFPDKEQQLVLYCGGGFRSALSAASIKKMGYCNVMSMDGGIRAWQSAGYPVIS